MLDPDAVGFFVMELPWTNDPGPEGPVRYDAPSAAHAVERFRREELHHPYPSTVFAAPAAVVELFGGELPELT